MALWVDGMVIIGHGSSKSTFGAYKTYTMVVISMYIDIEERYWHNNLSVTT